MFGTAAGKHILDQVEELSSEANAIQEKISEDSRKLDVARADYSRIAEGIARGTRGTSEVAKNQRETAEIQARIDGNNVILATTKAKIRELGVEYKRREGEAHKEARQKEFAGLVQSIAEEYKAISEAAERLISERVWPATAKAQRLAIEFEDLGGVQEVTKLREILYAKYPSAEGELHMARLKARGWKPVAYLGGKHALLPIALTIQAMVPKEK
jgi:hypothetical protein